MPNNIPGDWLQWEMVSERLAGISSCGTFVIRLDEMGVRCAWAPGSTIGAVVHWDVI